MEKVSHSGRLFIIMTLLVMQWSLWCCLFYLQLDFFLPVCMVSDEAKKKGWKLVSLTVSAGLLIGNHRGRFMAALWARTAIKTVSADIL